mgnify:CR=1 FL=1
MKKIILLLIPIFLTSVFADWSKIGNKENLILNSRLISYAVDEDEKHLLELAFQVISINLI